jgi:hypothetical protein
VDTLDVAIEIGPKGKRTVAIAPQWPGLSRGDKTEEAAVARLLSYVPRYAPVADLAGLTSEYPSAAAASITEHYPGTGSTDFWGISFAYSTHDKKPMSIAELDRELSLLRASWTFFDQVRSSVSAEMRKGPRGGGKDRDRIVRHVLFCERDWSLDPQGDYEDLLTDEGLRAHRDAYCDGIRTYHAEGKTAKKWPLRYMIRHTAFHTLDHAWEMEDKDLTER